MDRSSDGAAQTTAHTPGPWKPVECAVTRDRAIEYVTALVRGAIDQDANLHVVTQASEDVTREGHIIVSVVGNGPQSPANARLIAAAPEMYQALERIKLGAVHPECREIHASGDCQCDRLIARDALARARGEA